MSNFLRTMTVVEVMNSEVQSHLFNYHVVADVDVFGKTVLLSKFVTLAIEAKVGDPITVISSEEEMTMDFEIAHYENDSE